MRHKGIPKEETRRNVLDAASRGFRKHGFSGVGVDGIAKSAGVTSGAFYAHLGSKNKAFEAALVIGLEEVIQALPQFQEEHGKAWTEAFAAYYLGIAHRTDMECGCAMASMTADVTRSTGEIQSKYAEKMHEIATLVANGLSGSNDACRARAWSFLSILIGGLNVMRGFDSPEASEKVAEVIKQSAVAVAGSTKAR